MTLKVSLAALAVVVVLLPALARAGTPDAARRLSLMRQRYERAPAAPRLISLPPGAVAPRGWLRDWAASMARGITGRLQQHAETFRHGWTGEDFEARGEKGIGLNWPLEQSAYWLDGLVRLAHMLDDPSLRRRAHKRLDRVVRGVNRGGASFIWWRPRRVLNAGFNNWAHSHMGRALVGYYRATGDERVLRALVKAYEDYPVPDMRSDFFGPVSGACNIDPMLMSYLLSGERSILDQITDAHRQRIRRTSPGRVRVGFASPSDEVTLPLTDAITRKGGPLVYEVAVEEGGGRTVALGFCVGEQRKTDGWVQKLVVEGASPRTLHVSDALTPNEPLVHWFGAEDVDGDGRVTVRVKSDRRAGSQRVFLNGVWAFSAGQAHESEALLRGPLRRRSVAAAHPRVPYAARSAHRTLIDRWADGRIPEGHAVIYHENIRVPALTSIFSGDRTARRASVEALEWGWRRHGLPLGLVSGEEAMMGRGPIRGVETCNVAAASWTLRWMLQLTGEARYGDRVERIVLNAGPAAISEDATELCYFQTVNHIEGVIPRHAPKLGGSYKFSPLGSEVLCCAGNVNRVIPFYVQHMWMATADGGLAATLYGPGRVRSFVGDGAPVEIVSRTEYPFGGEVRLSVRPERPTAFPLHLRVPGWCTEPELRINGRRVSAEKHRNGHGFLRIAREWSEGDTVSLELSMPVRIHRAETNAVPDYDRLDVELGWKEDYFKKHNTRPITGVKRQGRPFAYVTRGPLLYALPVRHAESGAGAARKPWHYAIPGESSRPVDAAQVTRRALERPWRWSVDRVPVSVELPVRRFAWSPKPDRPLPETEVEAGRAERISLVPYGCAKNRVTALPIAR